MTDRIDFTERERDPANWNRDKELAYWNRPYVFQPFPKMLYRGTSRSNGSIDVEQRVVGSEQEELLAVGVGWCANPQTAIDHETTRVANVGVFAAERAYDDRRLSPAAQAEARVVDEATAKHLGEIPEGPKPKRAPRARK
jgi:hypothetical protein